MTLNGYFTINSAFFAGISGALKHGFRSLATLKLLVNVGKHQTETNRIARFPCGSTAFLSVLNSDHTLFHRNSDVFPWIRLPMLRLRVMLIIRYF